MGFNNNSVSHGQALTTDTAGGPVNVCPTADVEQRIKYLSEFYLLERNELVISGWQNSCITSLTAGWMFVYTIQPVVQPVVKPV